MVVLKAQSPVQYRAYDTIWYIEMRVSSWHVQH